MLKRQLSHLQTYPSGRDEIYDGVRLPDIVIILDQQEEYQSGSERMYHAGNSN